MYVTALRRTGIENLLEDAREVAGVRSEIANQDADGACLLRFEEISNSTGRVVHFLRYVFEGRGAGRRGKEGGSYAGIALRQPL